MKVFNLNEIQAHAILDMRLRSLRKLEEIELKKEMKIRYKYKHCKKNIRFF